MPTYTVETHYLDVGQGDCSLIVVKDVQISDSPFSRFDPQVRRVILIDCGSDNGPKLSKDVSNPIYLTLVNKLVSLRIELINVVVITHYDNDHFGGIVSMMWSGDWEYFRESVFYDLGSILTLSKDHTTRKVSSYLKSDPTLSWTANYNLYTAGLKSLYDNYTQEIRRPTERIYCGWPLYFSNGLPNNSSIQNKIALQPENHKNITLEVIDLDWHPINNLETPDDEIYSVEFSKCSSLLGTDFINEEFKDDKLPVSLICLAVNGWVYDPKTEKRTKVNITNDQKNAFSIGALLKFNHYTAYFGGDLTAIVENSLINSIKWYNPSGLSVLKAAHHGSANSTNSPFINELAPHTVIITCGETGMHSHPSLAVVKRLHFEEKIKKVILTGFGGDSVEGNSAKLKNQTEEYRKANFPTEIWDPYNPLGKYAISGSSWDFEPGHICISNINQNEVTINFMIRFYAAFKRSFFPVEQYQNEITGKNEFTPLLFLTNSRTLELALDTKTNENRLLRVKDVAYASPLKRKREDDDPDPGPVKPRKKRRQINQVGGFVKINGLKNRL